MTLDRSLTLELDFSWHLGIAITSFLPGCPGPHPLLTTFPAPKGEPTLPSAALQSSLCNSSKVRAFQDGSSSSSALAVCKIFPRNWEALEGGTTYFANTTVSQGLATGKEGL